MEHHAAEDPPPDGRLSIGAEVDAERGPQDCQDLLEVDIILGAQPGTLLGGLVGGHVGVLADPRQFAGDLIRRQDEIDTAASGRALRHTRVLGGRLVLGESDAARGLDFLHPQRAVGACARQDHADRGGLPVLGQRLQEQVDRQVRAARPAAGQSCKTPWAIVIVVFLGMT